MTRKRKTPRVPSAKVQEMIENAEAMALAAKESPPFPEPSRNGTSHPPPDAEEVDEGWLSGNQVSEEEVSYFWKPWVAYKALTLLAGESEAGKSTLLARLIAAATGKPFANEVRRAGGALLLAGEEDLGTVVVPRLRAAGAHLSRCVLREPGGSNPVTLPGSLDRLVRIVKARSVTLVAVDPITSYAAHGYSLNDEQQTREVLDTLVELASRTGCACIVTRNLRKGEGAPLDRIIGSVAFRNVPRSVLLAVPHPAGAGKVLVHGKCSIGAEKAPSIKYWIKPTADGPFWEGAGRTNITLEHLGPSPDDPGVRDESEAAEAFVRAYVGKEWVRSSDVYAAGAKEALRERDIRRAARQLGVEIRRHGSGSEHRSEWRMPKGGFGQ